MSESAAYLHKFRAWLQRRSYERSMREHDRIRDWFLRVQQEHDRRARDEWERWHDDPC